jgi:hypothetical protein
LLPVIGSGIGAASTCYFLNKLFVRNVHIDVFESAKHVGGRSESIKSMEQAVESLIQEIKDYIIRPRQTFFGLDLDVYVLRIRPSRQSDFQSANSFARILKR